MSPQPRMSILRSKYVDYFLVAALAVYAIAAFTIKPNFGLIAFGNIAQAVLQAVAVFALLLNAWEGQRHQRVFWLCIAAGGALWFAGQCLWVYYEVVLRAKIPSPFIADILFFLHIVPILAAASLQPHAEFPEGDDRIRLGSFDFGMLLVWWIFIYGYLVAPWEYVTFNERDFGSRYNFLYLIENLFVITAFGVMWLRTANAWRKIYRWLFIACAVYAYSSYVINVALDEGRYYTGGPQDIPLVGAILLQAYVGFLAYRTQLKVEPALLSLQTQRVWHARLATLAVISMPLFGFWLIADVSMDLAIQRFRLTLTLSCMLALMALLFFKQALLDRKLLALLRETRESYDDLQRLQTQLVQTEKLASIGRLVAGAAHEINNPLTAILGYSDLLVEDNKLPPEQLDMAQKIRQQARRTKQLVQNFLTFAKQSPVMMQPLDFNAVVVNALQLQELDQRHNTIETIHLLPDHPVMVRGDENHLLQMCVHIFNNAVEAMAEAHGKGKLTVSLAAADGQAVLRCLDTGPGVTEPTRIFDPFYTTKAVGKGTGLGLSACYGIIREHGGLISCENLPQGGALFQVTLPLAAEQVSAASLASVDAH
ncbi:MAG TPA: HAMP domain-containing sensor histidine kinase [Terriglobales bacterium]|nr:HAMP domain-containing sensor histidine kinase [Terriglobales bacterium]